MKNGLKRTWQITYGTVGLVLIGTKLRHDSVVHSTHQEHMPCKCDRECLRCLLVRP